MSSTLIVRNQHQIKKFTDRHLAQVVFTADMDAELVDKYFRNTTWEKQRLGRIKFLERTNTITEGNLVRVFGVVSHGYGYDIEQDILNSIERS